MRLTPGRSRMAAHSGLIMAALLLRTRTAAAVDTLSILSAGSPANVMRPGVGPADHKAPGGGFPGDAGRSAPSADQIRRDAQPADVFISPVPSVNTALMGPEYGNRVSWPVTCAPSPLLIGHSPSSRFAADFESRPWHQVPGGPAIRIGSNDPEPDPKGKLTLIRRQGLVPRKTTLSRNAGAAPAAVCTLVAK